jgi:hypothetical protein
MNEQIGSLVGAAVNAVTTDVRFFTIAMLAGFVALGYGCAWADRRWKASDRNRLPYDQALSNEQRARRGEWAR